MKNIKKAIHYCCLMFGGIIVTFTIMYANVLANDINSSETVIKSEVISSSQKDNDTSDSQSTAIPLSLTITSSAGNIVGNITDDSYNTTSRFSAGDTISISSSSDQMYGIYIKWNSVPDQWTLTYNNEVHTYGQNGYLHEYVEIPSGTNQCTMTFSRNSSICEISAYSKGTLPDDIQVWNPSCEKADILVFSTHADDEILFLGGVLATYAGQQNLKVQVVYMTNYWNGAKIREHEKLDGLWCSGVHYYPVNGDFDDLYSKTLKDAKITYNYDSLLSFITEQIRRFQPLVCVTQDEAGEYGHGGHMILAESVKEASNSSKEENFCQESVAKYGTWDVPKTYLHLYPDNKIHLNLRTPLSNMKNLTSLEIQDLAYKKHVSQQWCWFFISDENEYSCADFGLYRSTVGNDTDNNMLEHILTYEEQDRLTKEKEEAESIAASEAESQSVAEAENIAKKQQKAEETNQQMQRILMIASILFFVALLVVLGVFCSIRLAARIKTRHNK